MGGGRHTFHNRIDHPKIGILFTIGVPLTMILKGKKD
tara:strand:+ start:1165 stop:1275 length:111 start_codon:yes stop_codon:yes gene_type:complete